MPKKRKRGHGWSSAGRKRIRPAKFSINPKQAIIQPSSIPGAGQGFFLVESVEKGERIAVYSGKKLTKSEVDLSNSEYIVQICSNVFLDAIDKNEKGKGKFMNCGRKSKRKINAEFASHTVCNYNKKWNMHWISVYSTCKIVASPLHPVEILVDYGKDYWKGKGNPMTICTEGADSVNIIEFGEIFYM
jgi:hypothetical protein